MEVPSRLGAALLLPRVARRRKSAKLHGGLILPDVDELGVDGIQVVAYVLPLLKEEARMLAARVCDADPGLHAVLARYVLEADRTHVMIPAMVNEGVRRRPQPRLELLEGHLPWPAAASLKLPWSLNQTSAWPWTPKCRLS